MSNKRLILVNDGSTDSSLEICEKYKREHENIVIVDKVNGGLADARNAGLNVAESDYIVFIDPDDYVENDYFSVIEELVLNGDFPVFSYRIRHIDFGDTDIRLQQGVLPTGSAMCTLEKSSLFNSVCNKVYHRKIIEQLKLRFKVNSEPGEDLLFNCEYFKYVDKVRLSDKILYNYMRNGEDSLANKFRANLWDKNKKFISAIERLFSFYNLNNTDEKKVLALSCVAYVHSNIPNMYRKGTKYKKAQRVAFYAEILSDARFYEYFSLLETDDKLFSALKKIYLKGSAKKMDRYYSFLMFIRNNLQGVYNFFRKHK